LKTLSLPSIPTIPIEPPCRDSCIGLYFPLPDYNAQNRPGGEFDTPELDAEVQSEEEKDDGA